MLRTKDRAIQCKFLKQAYFGSPERKVSFGMNGSPDKIEAGFPKIKAGLQCQGRQQGNGYVVETTLDICRICPIWRGVD